MRYFTVSSRDEDQNRNDSHVLELATLDLGLNLVKEGRIEVLEPLV